MAIKVAARKNNDIAGLMKDIEQPGIKAVIYFFSVEFEQFEPQKTIKRTFPQAVCIGASMIGGWCTSGALEKGITALSFSGDEIEAVFVSLREGVKDNPVQAAQAVIEDLRRKIGYGRVNPNQYLGIILFDGNCRGEEIIKQFTSAKGLNLPFIGGAAADEMAFTKTLVSADEKLSDDGLAVMVMKMKIPFFYNHYVHCTPTQTSFVITKSEPLIRTVWEIDGQPAAPYYAKLIGVSNADKLNPGHFAANPLGIVMADRVYVRAINCVSKDGSGLVFACNLENETRVYLLKRGDIIENVRKALRDVEAYIAEPQGAILFNCLLRYLEMKELRKVDVFNDVFKHLNFIGFNTYGEELFTHHNQTLTAVFFGR